MKRALTVLLLLGVLLLALILVPRGEDEVPTPTVDRAPPTATPLPGYREEASSVPENAKPEARLRGRPPVGEPRNLRVRVVDPEGTPVPQALLVVERGVGEDWREWVESVAAGETRVAGPRGAEAMNLDVKDARDASGAPLALLPRRVEGIEAGQAEVSIVLAWSRRLAGTVRDTDGNGVVGVGVRACPPSRFSAGREAVTDEDGRFEIVGLPPGPLEARLRRNDHCVGPPTLAIGPNQEHLDVEVDPLVPFTFTVVSPDGEPVKGIRMHVSWVVQNIPQSHRGETDEDGRIVVPSLPRAATLYAYTEWYEGGPDFPETDLVGIAAADGSADLRLFEPVTIEGDLVDSDGDLVEVGWVQLEHLPAPGERYARDLDEKLRPVRDGRFRFERLRPGRYLLHGGGTIHEAVGGIPLEVEAPASGVRLRIRPYVEVQGRIVGANPADVVVQWFAPGRHPELASVRQDGTFSISGVLEDRGALYAFHKITMDAFLLGSAAPADGPFTVECDVAHPIAGRVPDYEKRAWNPELHAVLGPVRLHARIRRDGTFQIFAVPPGGWMLEWSGGGHILDSIEVQPGDENVVVPLPPEALMGR